jgi:hypothetical protein
MSKISSVNELIQASKANLELTTTHSSLTTPTTDTPKASAAMHLMYTSDAKGNR